MNLMMKSHKKLHIQIESIVVSSSSASSKDRSSRNEAFSSSSSSSLGQLQEFDIVKLVLRDVEELEQERKDLLLHELLRFGRVDVLEAVVPFVAFQVQA